MFISFYSIIYNSDETKPGKKLWLKFQSPKYTINLLGVCSYNINITINLDRQNPDIRDFLLKNYYNDFFTCKKLILIFLFFIINRSEKFK
jgi:hypothetical protein